MARINTRSPYWVNRTMMGFHSYIKDYMFILVIQVIVPSNPIYTIKNMLCLAR